MQHKVLGTLIGIVLVFPAMSMAGDKTQSTLVDRLVPPAGAVPAVPNPSAGFWMNGTSKGKTKGDDKCKVQIQMKGIALPDSDQVPCSGDEVICVAHSHTTVLGVPTDVSAVFRGEVKSGAVKIKRDLFAEGTGCTPSGGVGGLGIQQYDGGIYCFLPDGGYPPPVLPFLSCPLEGIYPLGFGPIPVTPVIATEGLHFK
jgi:hypothetical protein